MEPISLLLATLLVAPPPPAEPEAEPAPSLDTYGDPLPAGAVARYGTLRFRGGETSGAAFLPGGKTIVSSGADNCLYFWEADTGKLLRRYPAFSSDANPRFAISPDGKQVVTGNYYEKDLFVRSLADGKVIRRLKGLKDYPYILRFSPDGKFIAASEGTTGGVLVWNVRTGRVVTRLQTGRFGDKVRPQVFTLAFSRDGKYIVIANQEAEIFDGKSWEHLGTLKGHTDTIVHLAFSPDSATVITSSWDKTIRLWDRASGKETRRLANDVDGPLALSRDGKTVYGTVGGRHCAWDLKIGKRKYCAAESIHANGYTLSKDGTRLLGFTSSAVVVFDAMTGKCLTPMPVPAYPPEMICFAPDGKSLGLGFRDGPWQFHTWRFKSGQATRLADVKGINPSAIRIDNHDQVFAYISLPKVAIEVRNLTAKKRVALLPSQGDSEAAVFTAGGMVYTVGEKFIGWDLAANRVARRTALRTALLNPHSRILLSADERTLLTDRDEDVHCYDARLGQELANIKLGKLEFAMALSGDGKLFVAGDSSSASLRSTSNGAVVKDLGGKGVPIRAAAFSPDGRLLAIADGAGAFQLWDMKTRQRLRRLVGHRDGIRNLLFSPDSRWLASASGDTTILVWDVRKIAPGGK